MWAEPWYLLLVKRLTQQHSVFPRRSALVVLAPLTMLAACSSTTVTARRPMSVEVDGPYGAVSAPLGFPLSVESVWSAGDAVYDCFPTISSAEMDKRGTSDAIELRLVFTGKSVRVETVNSQTGLDGPTRRCIEASLLSLEWQVEDAEVTVPFTISPGRSPLSP